MHTAMIIHEIQNWTWKRETRGWGRRWGGGGEVIIYTCVLETVLNLSFYTDWSKCRIPSFFSFFFPFLYCGFSCGSITHCWKLWRLLNQDCTYKVHDNVSVWVMSLDRGSAQTWHLQFDAHHANHPREQWSTNAWLFLQNKWPYRGMEEPGAGGGGGHSQHSKISEQFHSFCRQFCKENPGTAVARW